MDYRQLRAEYDAAFDRLRRTDGELRSIRRQPSPDKAAQEMALQRFDQAMDDYRESRKNLADFLLAGQAAAAPATATAPQTLGVWTIGTADQAAGPSDTSRGRRDQVRVLAHRLWEEAGRPVARAEEHWYQAEEMARCGQ